MVLRRYAVVIGIGVLAGVAGLTTAAVTAPGKGDRTISFYQIHTQERITVTYKKDGNYVPEAMAKINWILRDWRKNQATQMSPATIDLAWEMHNELGSQEPIHIISGYRSPATNAMLRRTVGGQASKSQHMTGKAMDITFPDVPLKRMRYSALIRERGGVGYYPTSGIPFVHVDTANVRAWPRLPRYELALLFPSGRTRHMPAQGGPISASDVREAQSKYRDLAVQIAQFHDDRRNPKPATTLVASARPAVRLSASLNTPAAKSPPSPERRPFAVASLGDSAPASPKAEPQRRLDVTWEPLPQATAKATVAGKQVVAAFAPPVAEPVKPRLVAEPRIVERSSQFTQGPSKKDRSKLDALVQQASLIPKQAALVPPSSPKLISEPKPAVRPQKALAAAAVAAGLPGTPAKPQLTGKEPKVAAFVPSSTSNSITDMSPDSLGTGWVQAPEFDEDHPEELAYRPFPLAPLLTDTPSAHDPQLAGLQHPDVAATLDMLDDVGAIVPMRFRPGQQVAQVLWAQQFQGKAVHLDALQEMDQNRLVTPAGIENRAVRTSKR
ncbi:MAG: hypothetical protein CTY31_11050 [Hyphomicrobium sp.]|nr:MAG: hypothetical protein CTY39_01475 [Hyphomicrobium sp.]PPC98956.1 MAG: hypothetical protein CTY31_11050 [Hyphomicrobium sp.]